MTFITGPSLPSAPPAAPPSWPTEQQGHGPLFPPPPAPPAPPGRTLKGRNAIASVVILVVAAVGFGAWYAHQHETRFGPKKSGWGDVAVEQMRYGLSQGTGTSAEGPLVDCLLEYVESHYTGAEIEAMDAAGADEDDPGVQAIGAAAGTACADQ